jgi:hypothetical protein
MKKKLTLARRVRIGEILADFGDGVSIDTKAGKVARCLGEPCTFGQALSLLAQFRSGKKRRGKSRSEIEHERFLRMKAQRTDVY